MQNGNYIQQNISDVFLSNAEMFIYTLYPLISPRNIFRINVKPIVMLPMKKTTSILIENSTNIITVHPIGLTMKLAIMLVSTFTTDVIPYICNTFNV